MNTSGLFTAGKPNTDLQIFLDASGCATVTGGTPATSVLAAIGASGYAGVVIPASASAVAVQKQINNLLLRTGMLNASGAAGFATNPSPQAFGTSNGPGPNNISGTSGPLGLSAAQIVPPIPAASLATLKGPTSGAPAKGLQINTVDALYQVLGGAATAIALNLEFLNPAAPGNDIAVTPTAVVTASALNTTVNSANTKIHRVRVTLTNPAMIVNDCTSVLVNTQATTPAGVTVGVIGWLLGCNYNLN